MSRRIESGWLVLLALSRFWLGVAGALIALVLTSGAAQAAVSFVAAASSNSGGSGSSSLDVAVPAGVVAGDVLIAQVAVRGGSGNSIIPGAGWTAVSSEGVSGNTLRQAAYWRVATASEPASYRFVFGSSDRAAAGIAAYRGVDSSVPVDQSSTPRVGSGSTVQADGVTTGYSDTLVLGLFSVAQGASFTPPGGMSERYDDSTTAGPNGVAVSGAELAQAANGATGNKSATASASAANIGQLLALKPAAALRADYHFDECAYTGTAGEIADSFGSANATPRNGLDTGTPGQVRRFGNFDTYARWAQTSIAMSRDWSVSVWFRAPFVTPAGSTRYHVFSSVAGGGDLLYLDQLSSGGAYRWGVYTTSGTTDGSFRFSTLSDGWHHMVLVGNGSSTSLYIDGTLRDTVARKAGGTLTYLGTSFDNVNSINAQGFRVPLDEYMVWDHVLNASQVSTIYANQLAGNNYDGSSRASLCGGVASFAINVGVGNASTCAPRNVIITARDSLGATLTGYTGTVSLSTSHGRGDWAKVTAAGALANGVADDGLASYTFAAADNGVAVLSLASSVAADVIIGAVDNAAPASASTSGALPFRDNALVLATDESALFNAANPVNAAVAKRAHKMKAELWTKNNAGLCTLLNFSKAAVATQFWLGLDPSHPTGALAPSVAAASSCASALGPLGTSKAAAGNLNLTFVGGAASFYLCSADVGKFALNAAINPPGQVDSAASIIDGASGTLTLRPMALAVNQIRAGALDNPNGAAATDTRFATAGALFGMNVGAYGWSAAADADSDGFADAGASFGQVSGGGALPAFAGSASFSATLNTPATGSPGALKTGVATVVMASGSGTIADLYYTEVGSFRLTGAAGGGAAVASYLGSAGVNLTPLVYNAAGARNDIVGRFVPAEFRLSAITRTHRSDIAPADLTSCGNSSFTYMGENFAAQFTLTAHASSSGNPVTSNYTGSFARLTLDTASLKFDITSGASTSFASTLSVTCAGSCGTWNSGSATVNASFNVARGVSAACTASEKPLGPFDTAVLGLSPQDADGVRLQAPLDFDYLADGSVDGRQLASAALRFGRLHLNSAIGSEQLNLVVPLAAQYWNGVGFVTNTADNCSKLSPANVKLQAYNPAAYSSAVPQANVQFLSPFVAAGLGSLRLLKPLSASKGSLGLCIDLDSGAGGDSSCQAATPAAKTYLQEYASCGSYTKDPSATVGFGLYKAPSSFIHFRENF